MTPAIRWSLLVAGEATLLLLLLMFGNIFTGSILIDRAHLVVLALLGGLGWLVILRRPSTLPVLLVVAPLPLLASLAITSVTSAYPSLSWFATWQCAAYIGILWLLTIQAQHPAGRRNLIAAIGVVVTIVIGAYLIEVALVWREWLGLGFPVTSLPLRPLYDGGLIEIPGWLADVTALATPIVATSLWARRARVAAGTLASAAVAAIVISGTRSVLLLVVGLSVMAALLAIGGRVGRRNGLILGTASIVVALIGLGVILLSARSFDEGRSSSYASAIDRFIESPIVGSGPDTYAVKRMSDAADTISNLAQPDSSNLLLTSAGETGLVGLAGLGLTIVCYAVAIGRSWRRNSPDRPIIAAAVLGVAVIAGHGMAELVFALIGVILIVLVCIAVATADQPPGADYTASRSRRLDGSLLISLLAIVVGSAVVVSNEATRDSLARAEIALPNAPSLALAAAREATTRSPDNAIAWWVRMVAADASGNAPDAVASARRIVALEGFGQEWLALGVLLDRAGDPVGARSAIDKAVAQGPVDPVVELNAAIYYNAAGARDQAHDAVRTLLSVVPNIEPILAAGPPGLASLAAGARTDAASDRMAAGDFHGAIGIALFGEDRELARQLVDKIRATDGVRAEFWQSIVSAWFGDASARAAHDDATLANPSALNLALSSLLAVRGCDPPAADRWGRPIQIVEAFTLSAAPNLIGRTPDFLVRSLPQRYPGVVWRMDPLEHPYVAGIWTFLYDRPACAR